MKRILLILLVFSTLITIQAHPLRKYPNLVYRVLGATYDYSWLIVEVLEEKGSTLIVNITYLETEKVVCRSIEFYRPHYAKSIVVEVNTKTWQTYYNGENIGRFPFYGIKPQLGEIAASTWYKPASLPTVIKTKLYHLIVVNAVNFIVVNETTIIGVLKPYTMPLSQNSIYYKLLKTLGKPKLEMALIYIKALDFLHTWTIEKETGIPIKIELYGNLTVQYLGVQNKQLDYLLPSTILTLLGVKNYIVLYLAEVTWNKPKLNIRQQAPVDPAPKIITVQEKKIISI